MIICVIPRCRHLCATFKAALLSSKTAYLLRRAPFLDPGYPVIGTLSLDLAGDFRPQTSDLL